MIGDVSDYCQGRRSRGAPTLEPRIYRVSGKLTASFGPLPELFISVRSHQTLAAFRRDGQIFQSQFQVMEVLLSH